MTAALEDAQPIDITDWGTLNTASSPTKLPLGQTPRCQNIWVDEKPGSVVTAPGFRKVGTLPSGNPGTFCINYFKASAGTQTFVVSDNSTVYTTVDFQNFTTIITGLSSSFQLRGLVIRDKLWLTNGSDNVRTFDGSNVVVLDGSEGLPDVPKGRFIAYHDERVWLYHIPSNRSQVAFSGLTDDSGDDIDPDNASAWPSDNTLQIAEGDADYGTGLIIYRGYLYLFKQYTIWRLIGYDEYTYSRVKCRASSGTGFNESLQIVDNLVHMIGIDGIYVFDGDDADRISDIIDPGTATQASFGFNQLQQPNAKKLFWEVASTSDWNAGTVVPTNATVSDSLAEKAVDDTQDDFTAGVLKTNVDVSGNPDSLQLARVVAGAPGTLLSTNKTGTISVDAGGATIGNNTYITDGNVTNYVGAYLGNAPGQSAFWKVDLGTAYPVGRVIIKGFYVEKVDSTPVFSVLEIQGSNDNSSWTDIANVTHPSPIASFNFPSSIFYTNAFFAGSNHPVYHSTETDITIDFTTVSYRYVRFKHTDNGLAATVIRELEIYEAGYQSSGKFISQSLDYVNVPTSYGNFNADVTLNSEMASFFTQSSDDGSAWGAEITCTNGGAIGSALKRYLRWGVYLASSLGINSPVIADVFLSTKYESAIHNTGGSIFAWGPMEAEYNLAGQTIRFYYRGDSTAAGVISKSWNLIVPGGVLGLSTTNVYVQFKIEILGGTATTIPKVLSVTINWVQGTGIESQTLQNVASFFWRNRYWMAAASGSSSSNDTILIRGKKTFKSPWMLKDWPILSFCRFQDNLYGCSSVDGSIYQLDSGYSKDGSDLDSYFETGDFTMQGQMFHCHEVIVEVEKSGSYNLSFGHSVDRGVTWKNFDVDLTPSDTIPSYWKRINVKIGPTPIVRFRVRTNGTDQPFEAHNLRAFLEPTSARGSIPLRS